MSKLKELLSALDQAVEDGDLALAKAISKKIKKVKEEPAVIKSDSRKNKFVDDGSLFKEESVKQPDTIVKNGVVFRKDGTRLGQDIRKCERPEYQPVSVTCRECGRKYEVNPTIAVQSYDNDGASYRCNRCMGG